MPRSVIAIVIAIVAVILLGYVGVPYIQRLIGGESMEVRVTILSAFVDPEVGLPGKTIETVPRIVAEMEIVFPYGTAPDNFTELSVRGDDGVPVDVNWGSKEVEKLDIEDRRMTKYIVRQAFFPTDFKQGMLRTSKKELCYFKMPKLPHGNVPSAE